MERELERRSILLVDDVELFLELEKTFFHRDGVDLLMAINAQEVMQLLPKRKPDLIFLDMQLAGARGDEVCRWIKQDEEFSSIPVIMVVPVGDHAAETLCRSAGCDQIIHSPVKRQQLLAEARKVLQFVERQDPRVSVSVLVQYGADQSCLQPVYSVDLGRGGLFIACAEVAPVASLLSLCLQLPGEPYELSCQGRVAWLNHSAALKRPHLPSGMGVEFVNLSSSQHDHVEACLAHMAF